MNFVKTILGLCLIIKHSATNHTQTNALAIDFSPKTNVEDLNNNDILLDLCIALHLNNTSGKLLKTLGFNVPDIHLRSKLLNELNSFIQIASIYNAFIYWKCKKKIEIFMQRENQVLNYKTLKSDLMQLIKKIKKYSAYQQSNMAIITEAENIIKQPATAKTEQALKKKMLFYIIEFSMELQHQELIKQFKNQHQTQLKNMSISDSLTKTQSAELDSIKAMLPKTITEFKDSKFLKERIHYTPKPLEQTQKESEQWVELCKLYTGKALQKFLTVSNNLTHKRTTDIKLAFQQYKAILNMLLISKNLKSLNLTNIRQLEHCLLNIVVKYKQAKLSGLHLPHKVQEIANEAFESTQSFKSDYRKYIRSLIFYIITLEIEYSYIEVINFITNNKS